MGQVLRIDWGQRRGIIADYDKAEQCQPDVNKSHESGEVIANDAWSTSDRIRNLSAGIKQSHDGATFLSPAEAANVLGITVSKLGKIPVRQLQRFNRDGKRWYAVIEVATYKINHSTPVSGKTDCLRSD